VGSREGSPRVAGRWGGALAAVVAIGALTACSGDGSDQGEASPPAATRDGSGAAAEQGENLTNPQAQDLEKKLQGAPTHIQAREELVGYYYLAQAIDISPTAKPNEPSASLIARDRHLLWLIQNAPRIELLGTDPIGIVEPAPDAAGYAAAKDAWTKQA